MYAALSYVRTELQGFFPTRFFQHTVPHNMISLFRISSFSWLSDLALILVTCGIGGEAVFQSLTAVLDGNTQHHAGKQTGGPAPSRLWQTNASLTTNDDYVLLQDLVEEKGAGVFLFNRPYTPEFVDLVDTLFHGADAPPGGYANVGGAAPLEAAAATVRLASLLLEHRVFYNSAKPSGATTAPLGFADVLRLFHRLQHNSIAISGDEMVKQVFLAVGQERLLAGAQPITPSEVEEETPGPSSSADDGPDGSSSSGDRPKAGALELHERVAESTDSSERGRLENRRLRKAEAKLVKNLLNDLASECRLNWADMVELLEKGLVERKEEEDT